MTVTESIPEDFSIVRAPVASGSSFYAAMRVLPQAQREAMYEIYGFCRAVDDIADGELPRGERHARLQGWGCAIDAMYAGTPPAALLGLARQVAAFGLERDDFHAVIAGMMMDAAGDIRAPDDAELDLYCDRVASAVGRLSVKVFGMPREAGIALAHHLGRALQLTNILRDVDEDAALGRVYLSAQALDAAGIATREPLAILVHPALGEACALLAQRALAHYAEADAIMRACARRTVRAPRIMALVYRTILDGLLKRGWAAPRARVSIARARLLRILLGHALF